jgi:uncharacterized membrane protein YdjX (TVP38/TMEM64 family)
MLSSDDGRGGSARVALVVFGLGIALVIAWKLGFFGLTDRVALSETIERARSMRNLSLLFVITYALAAGIGVPATPLTIAGGALFGARLGVPMNWMGEMLAAMIGFAIARSTGLRAGRRTIESNTSIGRLAQSNALATLFRLRLVPVAPFSLLNAGAAISGMSWRDFIVATAIGILPVTIIYTVSASKLVAGVEGSGRHALATALLSAAVLIVLSFIPALIRARRRRRMT